MLKPQKQNKNKPTYIYVQFEKFWVAGVLDLPNEPETIIVTGIGSEVFRRTFIVNLNHVAYYRYLLESEYEEMEKVYEEME